MNKKERSCLTNTARLSYVWFANRRRIQRAGSQSEFMRPSRAEMADAYASDVTRLLSFRGEETMAVRRRLQTDREISDLRDSLQTSRHLRLLRSPNLSSHALPSLASPSSFPVASVNWFSCWDTALSLTVARKFHRVVSVPARNDSNDIRALQIRSIKSPRLRNDYNIRK